MKPLTPARRYSTQDHDVTVLKAPRWISALTRFAGLTAFAIVGIAMEIGIEPTVRHGADLGYVPVLVRGRLRLRAIKIAAARSVASLTFAGGRIAYGPSRPSMLNFRRITVPAHRQAIDRHIE